MNGSVQLAARVAVSSNYVRAEETSRGRGAGAARAVRRFATASVPGHLAAARRDGGQRAACLRRLRVRAGAGRLGVLAAAARLPAHARGTYAGGRERPSR